MSVALLLRPLIRAASRLRLARDARGRIAFPFLRRRRVTVYQIFVYHRVTDDPCPYFPGIAPSRFARQMELLAGSHRMFDLEELLLRAMRRDVPPGAAAVTFDDGYADFGTHAAPILARYGIPATVFLATGPLDGGGPLWHDRVFSAFRRSDGRPLEVEGMTLTMATDGERRASLERFLDRIRRDEIEAREARIRSLYTAMGIEPSETTTPAMLTWEEVATLDRAGVRFGAHTVHHPILSRIAPEVASREIRGSKDAVERRLGHPIGLFAYPVGSSVDYDDSVKALVRDAGFTGAVTTRWGGNDADSDPFELRRVRYWGDHPGRTLVRLAWYRLDDTEGR